MSVLAKICEDKRIEVRQLKSRVDMATIQSQPFYTKACIAVEPNKLNPFVIAEFKRKSPSVADINLNADPAEVAKKYIEKGASAISVLTDRPYFGGSAEDFKSIRSMCSFPMLRKEFIVDSYQIHETKAMGADIMLIIAAALDAHEIKDFYDLATELGMKPLVEIHEGAELDKLSFEPSMIGINSRDLKTLKTDYSRFETLFKHLPEKAIKVAESAIKSDKQISELHAFGYDAFLVGEALMTDQVSLHGA